MRSTKSPSWIERLAGLVPVPVPPHAFALGPSSLRYARFARGDSGFELEALEEAALPSGLFGDGPLGGPMHDPAAALTALDQVLAGSEPVTEASAVLPDAWLRVAFVEIEETPRSAAERDEMLRWKLTRTVPVRVEDVRLDAVQVASPPDAPGSRWLLCFGLESLLDQVEATFGRRGIRLGQLVPASLAAVAAVHEVAGGEGLTGLLTVSGWGYSVTFVHRGEPVLHRYRPLAEDAAGDAAHGLVVRDLKLTHTFLRERLPDADVERLLLAAPREEGSAWAARLAEGLGRPVVELGREQMPLAGRLPEVPMHRLAPLLGAACREVA